MTTPNKPDPSQVQLAVLAGLAAQTQKMSDAGIALVVALKERSDDLKNATQELEQSRRRDVLVRRLFLLISAMMLLIMAGVGVGAVLNYRNGSEIKSCTTPTGKCAKRNAAATEGFLERQLTAFCHGQYDPISHQMADQCAHDAIAELRRSLTHPIVTPNPTPAPSPVPTSVRT